MNLCFPACVLHGLPISLYQTLQFSARYPGNIFRSPQAWFLAWRLAILTGSSQFCQTNTGIMLWLCSSIPFPIHHSHFLSLSAVFSVSCAQCPSQYSSQFHVFCCRMNREHPKILWNFLCTVASTYDSRGRYSDVEVQYNLNIINIREIPENVCHNQYL
jgi:hypothetical protein